MTKAAAQEQLAANRENWMSRFGPWIVLALALSFAIGVRLRLVATPLERDEGEYAYAGQLLLQGIPPYREAFNMKFPGVYGAYAMIMAVFGETSAGIHLGFLIVNAVTIVLVYLLARRLFQSRSSAAVAAVTYAITSVNPGLFGTQAHATHFVILPVVAACLLLLRGRTIEIFAAGVLLGLAILMKQHGAIFVGFAAVYLIWMRRWKALLPLVAGVALPVLAMMYAVWRAGVWDNFVFWTFNYARQYVSEIPVAVGIASLIIASMHVIGRGLLLWLWALGGLAVLWVQRRTSRETAFVLGFFLFSFLAMCPGLFFREHYFVLILPAIALLAGAAFLWMRRRAGSRPASILFAVCALITIAVRFQFFFVMSPVDAMISMYGDRPFPQAAAVAEYLRKNTAETDRIAVLGSEPEIYFYAHRHSATGYIYTYGMMENQPFAVKMQADMIRDVEAARPNYLVFVDFPQSWGFRDNSNRSILRWWETFRGHYSRVSSANWDGGLQIWKRVD